jgi:hypothetical protein
MTKKRKKKGRRGGGVADVGIVRDEGSSIVKVWGRASQSSMHGGDRRNTPDTPAFSFDFSDLAL